MKSITLLGLLLFALISLNLGMCANNEDMDQDGFTPRQGDCNDLDFTVYPDALEVCDNMDNNCNGEIDEGLGCNSDQDGDGYTPLEGDCDDANAQIFPGAKEVCDGLDNDCNHSMDENLPCDEDKDFDGYTPDQGDCEDNDATSFPGSVEFCSDLKDGDCDGAIDEDDCTVDAQEVRYFLSGYSIYTYECYCGACYGSVKFWIDVKVKNLAYDKKVWVEMTSENSTAEPRNDYLTYERDLDDQYEIWGGDVEWYCSTGGCGSGMRCGPFHYTIHYQVDGQTYTDDNNGKGYEVFYSM
jgi:hypothetical protein